VWPAFSPDGTEIAFNVGEGDGGVFVVGATGESERRLTDFGGNPAWSPDSSTIAFATETVWTPTGRLTTNSSLWVVSTSGGAPRRLYAGDAVQPAWSPSGRRLAFWTNTGGQRDLVTISADGEDAVKVTDDAPLDWCPTWSPDGRHLYFASDRGGSMGLWRIPIDETTGRATGPPESVLPGTEASVSLPSFSRDGRTLVFRSRLHSVNPAAVPFDPVTFRLGAPRMLLERVGVLSPYSVSPDGAWIAMYNLSERQPDLFLMRSSGSDLRRLTDDDARDYFPIWWPDGTRLAFTSSRSGRYAAWSIRPDGSGLSMLAERTDAEIGSTVALSANGTAMFSTNDGRAYLARPPFPVPVERQESLPNFAVPTGTVVPYVWSPDSRKLAGQLVAPSGAVVGVVVYDLATRQPKVLTDDPWIFSLAFLPDSRQLFYFRFGTSDLVSVDVESGRRRVLSSALPFRVAVGAFALAPDARTLYVGAERTEANVWKLERNR
jgi:Tol biopolymer transport system component